MQFGLARERMWISSASFAVRRVSLALLAAPLVGSISRQGKDTARQRAPARKKEFRLCLNCLLYDRFWTASTAVFACWTNEALSVA